MSFVELLLLECMQNKNPLLDLQGTDRKVLQIAYRDFLNYLKSQWGLTGKENAEYELADRLHDYFHKNPKELEEFMNIWVGLWMKKWNERVKLLIGNENNQRWNKVNRALAKAEPFWTQLSRRDEMKDLVIKTLIKNGEICGTSILAENLIKMELGHAAERRKLDLRSKESILNVLNSALRRTRELSRSKGPLIFVRIDKSFFQLMK